MTLFRIVCAAIVLQTCLTWSVAQELDDTDMSIDQAILEAYDSSNVSQRMNNPNVLRVELDMLFSADAWHAMMRAPESDANSTIRTRRKAMRDESLLWPNAEVPYTLAELFVSGNKTIEVLREAMNDYHTYTCVRFRQKMPEDVDYVRIVGEGGCSSYVGRQGGDQELRLSNGCRMKGVIIHELGHAIGLIHEHSRPDRDQYVLINRDNIMIDFRHNFEKFDNLYVDVRGIPYDYESIMHYSKNVASINGQLVITTANISYQNIIGKQNGLSFRDVKLVNKMYRCSDRSGCGIKSCPGEGFIGRDCKCWCPSGRRDIAAVHCPASGHCEAGWTQRGQSCYKVTNASSWTQAQLTCLLMNALLTHNYDGYKQNDIYEFLQEQHPDVSRAWIGLSDQQAEGRWIWNSSQRLTYASWIHGEPNDRDRNEDCVELIPNENGNWNDVNCDHRIPGLCEKRQGHCETGWTLRKQTCYKLTNAMSWIKAQQACLSMNASLTRIDNSKKQNDVYDFVRKQRIGRFSLSIERVWIGLNDRLAEGQWIWDSGRPVTYVNWSREEPNDFGGIEDCVEVLAHGRAGWNDRNCNYSNPGVCEKLQRTCGGTFDGWGKLQSTNYPGDYPNNLDCTWELQAEPEHEAMVLQITYFSTESCCDILRITDNFGHQLSLSGIQQPRNITLGRRASVYFTTDYSETSSGFEIGFTSLRKLPILAGTCGGTFACWGNLQSTNYPGDYPNNLHLTWEFQAAPEHEAMLLQIIHFSTQKCCDYLRITDNLGNQLSRSGMRQPHNITLGRRVTIDFTTDSSETSSGFEIAFSSLEKLPNVTGKCEAGWTQQGQSCYKVTNALFWAEARQTCLVMNAFLTSIDDVNELNDVYDFLRDQHPDLQSAWIGLNDRQEKGRWIWDSGRPVTYVNWSRGQPDDYGGREDCVEAYAQSLSGWNDRFCDDRIPGICEKQQRQV